jgi:hypothetical protein
MRAKGRTAESQKAVENYIVRIYRRKAFDPDEVIGQIESVENAETLPFRGMAELVAILSASAESSTQSVEPRVKRFS